MPANSRNQEPSPQPTFVFKGTVRRVKSATMQHVPVNDQTTTVTVDQVLEAPKSLAKLGGSEITVQLSGREKVRPGQQLIFHTNGWMFGDSVVVQSVKQEPVERKHAALLSRGGDPVEHRYNRDVQARYQGADLVVSGRVSGIRLPAEGTSRATRARLSEDTTMAGPVSEHEAHWREAVIEVHAVHKGHHSQNDAVIRFPASMDVRWYRAPKFQPGQQGYFMLRKTKIPAKAGKGAARHARAAGVESAGEEAHTALHPADFQPYDATGAVQRIMATTPGEPE